MPESERADPGEREPVRDPGDGVTVEEGVNDPLPPAEEAEPGGDTGGDEPQEAA